MTKKVCKFYEMVGKHTAFDRGDDKFRLYLKSNLERKRVAYPLFLEETTKYWEEFKKSTISSNLFQFFTKFGQILMKKWYTDVFSFPKRRIHFEFKQGGSQVDVLISINYTLSEVENNCLGEILKKYNITDKNIKSAALIALLEPSILLGMEISKIIGQEIRVSIEDREIINDHIILDLSARPK
ncbi:MAG: hypothetical protein ACTSRS_02720 [Candidatus Helarchaeota archaeon]